jgi:hypothetical protein
MIQDKQQYSKVKTRIEGMARIAESVHSPLLFRNSESIGQDKLPEKLEESKIPDGLKLFLTEMDRKLNILLQLHSIKKLEDSYPVKIDIREISGEGIDFIPDRPIAENQILEVILILEQMPIKTAGAKGFAQKKGDIWHLDFNNIRENDQELIIQFVFSEQRELIRAQKNF